MFRHVMSRLSPCPSPTTSPSVLSPSRFLQRLHLPLSVTAGPSSNTSLKDSFKNENPSLVSEGRVSWSKKIDKDIRGVEQTDKGNIGTELSVLSFDINVGRGNYKSKPTGRGNDGTKSTGRGNDGTKSTGRVNDGTKSTDRGNDGTTVGDKGSLGKRPRYSSSRLILENFKELLTFTILFLERMPLVLRNYQPIVC